MGMSKEAYVEEWLEDLDQGEEWDFTDEDGEEQNVGEVL